MTAVNRINMNKASEVQDVESLFRVFEARFSDQYGSLMAFIHTRNQEKKCSNKEYAEIYGMVMRIADCAGTKAKGFIDSQERLFQYFTSKIRGCLSDFRLQIEGNANLSVEQFITTEMNVWDSIALFVHWMDKFFTYLDKYYLKDRKTSLLKSAFSHVKTEYFLPNAHIFRKGLLELIQKERLGQEVPSDLIKKAINHFLLMDNDLSLKKIDERYTFIIADRAQLKHDFFHEHFLVHYREDVNRSCQQQAELAARLPVYEYVDLCMKVIDREEELANKYFMHSKKLIMSTCYNQLISERAQDMIYNEGSGFKVMMNQRQHDQLRHLYKLLSKEPESVKVLAGALNAYINQQNSLIPNLNLISEPIEFVKILMQYREEINNIIESCFNNEDGLAKAKDNGFQSLINNHQKLPYMLAIYADQLFKKLEKGLSDQEIHQQQSLLVQLFSCIYSKDKFVYFYTKFLAKRLLNEGYAMLDNEAEFLNKLIRECASNALSKVFKMIDDIRNAKNVNSEFQKFCTKNPANFVGDFNVTVLTQGCWPENIRSDDKMAVTADMQKICSHFEKYYLSNGSSRKLAWVHSQSRGEILFKGKFTLLCNGAYMVTLLQFNSKEGAFTPLALAESTGIPIDELKKTVLIPLVSKYKILINDKSAATEATDIENDDILIVNDNFDSQQRRIPLLVPKIVQTKEKTEDESDQKEILKEREIKLEALIVRVMKGKKELSFNDLIASVVSLSRDFKPQPNMIKERIEDLIQRDYVKRDENDKYVRN